VKEGGPSADEQAVASLDRTRGKVPAKESCRTGVQARPAGQIKNMISSCQLPVAAALNNHQLKLVG